MSGGVPIKNWSQNEAPEAPKWRPKPSKIDVEKQDVFGIDFSRFGPRFGRFLGSFVEGKIHEMCNDFLLVKALKIALLSRRNANFQDIEVPTT